MRAARIHEWNGTPVVDEVAPPARASGETLVRVDAATVSHLDLTVSYGDFDLAPALPYVPGCEGAGTVIASDTLPTGTQVIFRDGAVGLDRDGTWQEQICVPDEALMALPVALEPALAATFFVPTTTAAVALFDIGRLTADQTVIVTGATGAVGSVAVQLAHNAGARVIAVVSRESRLSSLPPDVLGVALDDEESIAKLATERSADLLVDTIGGARLGHRLGWLAAGGAVVCVGYTAGQDFAVDLPNWLLSDVAILPVNLMRREAAARQYAHELLPRIADGTLSIAVDPYPLDEVATAWTRLQQGKLNGRAVIRL